MVRKQSLDIRASYNRKSSTFPLFCLINMVTLSSDVIRIWNHKKRNYIKLKS